MEPNLLPKFETRRFHSEAEYRQWQLELTADRRAAARPGVFTRLAMGVRELLGERSADQDAE